MQREDTTQFIRSDSLVLQFLEYSNIPITDNNKVKLIKSGREKFEDLFEAIRGAKHHIHLEYFNFRNDSIANALFDLLGKCGDRTAITAAGDYLSGALYGLLRQLYRRCGGNEDFFAVAPGDYDASLGQADMTLSRVRYRQALDQAEDLPQMTPDTLTAAYPGLGQSVAQVIHNTDERCKTLQ